jgi:AraC-like DNA-binding protein
MLVVSGHYQVKVGEEVWQGRNGSWFHYPPHTPHVPVYLFPRNAKKRQEYLLVQWTCEPQPEARPGRGHAPSQNIYAALHWLSALHNMGSTQSANELLRIILRELYAGRAQDQDLVDQVRRFVSENLDERESVAGLAAMAGLSPYHFARRFRAQAGMGPAAFARQVRLEHAYAMVLATDKPLAEIADSTGFSSAFHLSNLIRKRYGKAPTALRQRR